jgi:hypothetical protein
LEPRGSTVEACRAEDLIDKLVEHGEPVEVFCVHDADASGTMIYQTPQEETKARGARKIRITNLGLEPSEAVEMGLEVETIEETNRIRPVADYVRERDDGAHWENWLQTNRVELNAMTTPQLIEWLDARMANFGGKLVPPPHVLEQELADRLENKVRTAITERILREAQINTRVAAAVAKIKKPDGATLARDIKNTVIRQRVPNIVCPLISGSNRLYHSLRQTARRTDCDGLRELDRLARSENDLIDLLSPDTAATSALPRRADLVSPAGYVG